MSEKIAGILFLVTSVVGGVVGKAMFPEMDPIIGYALLAGCGVIFLLGCWLTLRSKKPVPGQAGGTTTHTVTSNNQTGGITAHTVTGGKDDGGR